jgi:hypothetical protein
LNRDFEAKLQQHVGAVCGANYFALRTRLRGAYFQSPAVAGNNAGTIISERKPGIATLHSLKIGAAASARFSLRKLFAARTQPRHRRSPFLLLCECADELDLEPDAERLCTA